MRFRFASILWLAALALGPARAEVTPWAHELSDLPANPDVVWGRLDNGLRYALCANAEPADRASLRLLVLAGSLHETDRQRGYAHFVEHLAFDGTRLYPGQTLHAALQKQGLGRGPDVNAHTHPDRTIYRLDLPEPTPERLHDALQVLREFADGLTFDPAEIERERGVILIEKRARDDHLQRSQAELMRFLFPDSPLRETDAFGTDESIQSATASELRAFYETWYRADNMVIVAAGTFEPEAVAQQIGELFRSLPARTMPRPQLDLRAIGNPSGLRVGVHATDETRNAVSVTLASVAPALPVDTRASLDAVLRRTIAFEVLNRRLAAVQRSDSARLTHASASYRSAPLFQQASMRIDVSAGQWRLAVDTLEQELRRVLLHGFTANEVDEARRKILAMIDYSLPSDATRTSGPYADALLENIADQRVLMSAADLAEIVRRSLATATPENCLAAFAAAWGPGHPQLFVSGDLSLRRPAEQLAAAYHRSARKPIEPHRPEPAPVFAYGSFGAPGRVVRRHHVADLDLHCVEFANGVRLNLKATSFEANRVLYGGRFGTGAAGEPKSAPGLRMVVDHGLGAMAVRRHDRQALHQLSAGHLVSFSFSAGEEAFYVSGLSDTRGAERLLHLLAAYFTDPGWRTSELNGIRQRVVARLNETTRNTGSYLSSHRHGMLAGGDPRYRLPERDQLLRHTLADFRRWIGPQLRSAPFELGIVGDFEVEEMIRLASRTIGCLPRRSPQPTPARVSFVDVLPPSTITVPATSRHGAVQLAWPVPPARESRADHQMELLADVLRNRLMAHVRGELGATYASSCQVWRSELQQETGYLIAALTCEPTDNERIATTSRAIADALARDGVTAEEFERARQPRLQSARVQLRTNSYWLGSTVAAAQSRPDRLDWPRNRIAELESITAAELSELAALVLPASRASLFMAAPDSAMP